jgi:hypothetical protein
VSWPRISVSVALAMPASAYDVAALDIAAIERTLSGLVSLSGSASVCRVRRLGGIGGGCPAAEGLQCLF